MKTEMFHSSRLIFPLILPVIFLAGCSQDDPRPSGSSHQATTTKQTNQAEHHDSVLKLASTTSTRDSGLIEILLPVFEKANHCRVDLIAVGTGAALKLGEAGDVDVVLVHARNPEEEFMAAGHGTRHEPIMHNFFIIAGPSTDPAKVKGLDAAAALSRIAQSKQRFVSRGDDSGTHKREQSLWRQVGGRPKWNDFIESGQGMGPTLIMADEMNAYVLADEGTWLKQSEKFQIAPLVRGTDDLQNPYSVMVVNSGKHPAINNSLANRFVDFLISEPAQRLIASYQINGRQLFHADRIKQEPTE